MCFKGESRAKRKRCGDVKVEQSESDVATDSDFRVGRHEPWIQEAVVFLSHRETDLSLSHQETILTQG